MTAIAKGGETWNAELTIQHDSHEQVKRLAIAMLEQIKAASEWGCYYQPVDDKKLKEDNNSLYWVKFHNGEVVACRFNDYAILGGKENYWQDLDHNDLPMKGTKYIKIKQPK